jgi:hypothetical protein
MAARTMPKASSRSPSSAIAISATISSGTAIRREGTVAHASAVTQMAISGRA